jgi:hypothetical protein
MATTTVKVRLRNEEEISYSEKSLKQLNRKLPRKKNTLFWVGNIYVFNITLKNCEFGRFQIIK